MRDSEPEAKEGGAGDYVKECRNSAWGRDLRETLREFFEGGSLSRVTKSNRLQDKRGP